RAGRLYGAVPGAVTARGVLQLEQAPRDAARFGKIAGQPVWPAGSMALLDSSACSTRLGEPVETGGLWMRDALAVRPAAILDAWLGGTGSEGPDRITATVTAIERSGGGWALRDARGEVVHQADVVVLAAGWGTAALARDLPLTPVRGQADWVEALEVGPVAWGGYAVPTGGGVLFGATHERDEVRAETSADAS